MLKDVCLGPFISRASIVLWLEPCCPVLITVVYMSVFCTGRELCVLGGHDLRHGRVHRAFSHPVQGPPPRSHPGLHHRCALGCAPYVLHFPAGSSCRLADPFPTRVCARRVVVLRIVILVAGLYLVNLLPRRLAPSGGHGHRF
jgi:hypothetical protein